MKNVYLLITLFCLSSLNSFALTDIPAGGNISGMVTTSDGQAAAAVTVEVEGIRKNAITNDKGSFVLKNIPAGNRRLRISLLGYETVIREILVENDATVQVNIRLEISQTQLKEVIIQDARNRVADKRSAYVARQDIGFLDNPQSYTVATKELLLEKNVQDYQTAVRAIPGVALSSESYQGIAEVTLRGFTSQPYIRNGIYFMNLVAGDAQNIERLEAIKGPSGTLYGSQGISYGGLINRVTKKPFQRFAGEAGISVGSYGFSRLTADLNTPLNEDKSALLRINAAAGWQGSFQDVGYARGYLFAPSFSYQVNDKFDILVDVELNSMKKPAATSYPVFNAAQFGYTSVDQIPMNYKNTYGSDRADYPPSTTYNFYAQFNYKLAPKWKLSTNLAYADFNFNSGTIGLNLTAPDSVARDIYDFYWQYHSIEVQPNLTGEFNIGRVKNKLLVGLDYQNIKTFANGYYPGAYDTIQFAGGVYPSFPAKLARNNQAYSDSYFEADYKQEGYAAYISDVISFNDRLNILLSLRYDHYKDGGYVYRGTGEPGIGPDASAFAPKLGITYQVLKDKMTLFANYMQGINYVAPDVSGQVFDPERARQAEGGVKFDLANGKLSSTISYYNIQVMDKVRTDPSNPNLSIQDGTQESKGVDVDIIASPVAGLNIVTGYAYNDSKFTKDDAGKEGLRPAGAPQHSGNIWISYTLQQSAAKGLGFGAGAVYSDMFYTSVENDLSVPSYTVFNANIFYNQPKFRLALSMDNIGNKQYYNVYGMPQMLRRLMGSVTFRF